MSIENCMIKDCRASEGCSGHACKNCGWNPKVAARRNRQMEIRGLQTGSDGLRRLVIRSVKRGGNNHGSVAGQQ